ncbi:helix-turn-helix domain-containing protein [Amycolatopsis vancoresmycina]|uniref:XRE family transcriptional regulator n=1 Tax=Amycolatopsis vancoresmycina DSM 44592 TaxID=1292037 RepID=R1I660_9PSEU|nr:helix-turn-helix transcriptional regulator [Amycolatopsis vancoresmycina]EOD67976.1 XRE family transcriptional regulator [Amycolatopsis vancoresmycina DSM 44592]
MHIPSDPELLKTQLGIELRRLREEAGFTALEACAAINAHTPKLSKLENGNQTADPEDIRKLAEFYRATPEQRDYLVALAEAQPKRRRRRKAAERDAVPDWFRRFLALEWDATEIRTYQVESVHGLLQTEAYARSNILAWEPEADPRLIDKQVETRLGRQTVLKRNGRPSLRFDMLLNEAVLRRVQGSKAIMREQLQHLVTASNRPNITIRVLPFSVPDRITMPSAFSLFRLQEQNFSTVYLEDLFGATYLKEPEEFTQYSVVYGRLRDAALDPEASRKLLAKVAESYK